MRRLFAFSLLLAGFLMTGLVPTASAQTSPRKAASGNTCDFGESFVAAQKTRLLLHLQVYGQPQERSILWARDPAMMRELQEQATSLRARGSPEQQ